MFTQSKILSYLLSEKKNNKNNNLRLYSIKKAKNIPKEYRKSAKQLNKMQVFAKSSLSHVQKAKFDCMNKNDTNLKIESNTKESRPAKPHINSIKVGNVSAEYLQQLKSYAKPNSSVPTKMSKLRYDSIPNSYVKREVLSLRNNSIKIKRVANKISKENIDSVDIEKKIGTTKTHVLLISLFIVPFHNLKQCSRELIITFTLTETN